MEGEQVSKEKKLTLLLLCWLFGLFAVHRFYTGKYVAGALHLLVAALSGIAAHFEIDAVPALGFPALALWWIIDTAHIIMGKYKDREGMPIVDWV